MSLYDAHSERLNQALEAARTRGAWTPFIESPSRRHHPEGAHAAGRAAFEGRLGHPFELDQPGALWTHAAEVSPYTLEPLGIAYAGSNLEVLLPAVRKTLQPWSEVHWKDRVGICMEILDRLSKQTFENAYATMHTAGQGFMMAFAGSGANSLDRGLEGIAYAARALSEVPDQAVFTRAFGRAPVTLHKRYRAVPRGIAAVVTCASYPAWNALPALFANLATGNPVVLKPHPTSVLGMAITVETARTVLREAGHDPNLVTLVVDSPEAPVTQHLLLHPDVAIVDFTGSATFGGWIETQCARKLVYTETSGCNSVVLHRVVELQPVLDALATSLTLFSAQMCTSAQNLFVPPTVETDDGPVSREAVLEGLVATIDRMTADPARAAGLCACVQSERTVESIVGLNALEGTVRAAVPYVNPDHPKARTLTPWVGRAAAEDTHYRREHFGPAAFVIATESADHALARATEDAGQHGSIANYVYSTDATFMDAAETAYWRAGSSVGFNLVGQSPINFTAAFSDFHVTGLNPAGTACLTDLAFVTDRFRIVQSKREQFNASPG